MTKVFTDGGARGNPGPAACAFVVYEDTIVLHKASEYLGETTNNVAEYRGVLLAFNWLKDNPPVGEINFFLDSELVVKQLKGIYKIKNTSLLELAMQIKKFEKDLGKEISYTNVPREKNKLADKLVNMMLDSRRRI